MVVEADRLADNGGIGAEAPSPEAVAEYGEMRRSRLVIAGTEAAPKFGLNGEHVEEVSADERLIGAFGFPPCVTIFAMPC